MAPRHPSVSPLSLLLLALAASSSLVGAHSHTWETHTRVKRSNIVTSASELAGKNFDFVIVGGGLSGLVLAGRLSENASVTVAVIEAGGDGSEVSDSILAPAQAYFKGIFGKTSIYDYHTSTNNVTELDSRQIYWPRGKLLGGGSAVNGGYLCRSSKIEHDSWASLNPGSNATWNWDAVYPHMKKSETWTAPLAANAKIAYDMTTDASLHGSSGPIHYSYPGYFYPQVGDFGESLAALGVESRDPAGGETWGAYVSTSAIDPSSWSRSYSKTGYLDPASSRSNLVVLTGFYATKVIFDNTTATGVSFQASVNGTAFTVNAAKEVILSAGVIGSPQLLQLSGVGDSALLTGLGINVVVDLPGVGMHLTDHLSAEIVFNTTAEVTSTGDGVETNTTIAAEQLALWKASDSSSLYNSPNDMIAYVNLTTLFGDSAATALIAEINANMTAQVNSYSSNSNIQAGYKAVYEAEVRDIFPSPVGQAEILMVNTGTYGAYSGKTIGIQAAIQHPLSRGSVNITSKSIFDSPSVDPGYLRHPADIQILREAFKFARKLSQTAPLSTLLASELNPGSSVSTDADWEAWIRKSASTEYHPAGSCAMLPLSLGGVVDASLRVHGTSHLRVVDASIIPIELSAHLMAPLYGIAENAYTIITSTNSTTSNGTISTSTGAKSPASRVTTPGLVGLTSIVGLLMAISW